MTLSQERHITELLLWIEKNLCNPLSLDIISKRSGYSKWHLQRLFRQCTHHCLASYIRARRLCLAALSLRYTEKSILRIALEYQFDTQQTFSRSFKRHFGETPGAYRKARNYQFSNLVPALSIAPPKDISIDYVDIPSGEYSLLGNYYDYHLAIEDIEISHTDVRSRINEKFYTDFKLYPEKTYTLTRFVPDGERVKVNYIVAVDKKHAKGHALSELPDISGEFCRIRYSGKPMALNELIIFFYTQALTQFDFVRREGYDLTQFHYSLDRYNMPHLDYEYLIPIMRATALS